MVTYTSIRKHYFVGLTRVFKQVLPNIKDAWYEYTNLTFSQKPNEAIHEAWERYKDLLRKCLHSGINGDTQMNLFYRGLNLATKTFVNASYGGTYSDKHALQAYQLFEKMAT